jgi:hypothetical protein
MGTQRDRFEAWLKRWRGQRTPDEEAALLRVADAVDRAMQTGKLSADDLKTIVAGASHKRAMLWENTTSLLSALAERFHSAADAIRSMFASRDGQARFAAICCIDRESHAERFEDLLTPGLVDKSSRVRWKAAEIIGRFERKGLLPQLERACLAETNAKAKNVIEFEFTLIRDGYLVKPSEPSGYFVTVRYNHGIRSGYITEEAMHEKGAPAIAHELRDGSR